MPSVVGWTEALRRASHVHLLDAPAACPETERVYILHHPIAAYPRIEKMTKHYLEIFKNSERCVYHSNPMHVHYKCWYMTSLHTLYSIDALQREFHLDLREQILISDLDYLWIFGFLSFSFSSRFYVLPLLLLCWGHATLATTCYNQVYTFPMRQSPVWPVSQDMPNQLDHWFIVERHGCGNPHQQRQAEFSRSMNQLNTIVT